MQDILVYSGVQSCLWLWIRRRDNPRWIQKQHRTICQGYQRPSWNVSSYLEWYFSLYKSLAPLWHHYIVGKEITIESIRNWEVSYPAWTLSQSSQEWKRMKISVRALNFYTFSPLADVAEQEDQLHFFPYWKRLHVYWRTIPYFNPLYSIPAPETVAQPFELSIKSLENDTHSVESPKGLMKEPQRNQRENNERIESPGCPLEPIASVEMEP